MRYISSKHLFVAASVTLLFLIVVWLNAYVIKSSIILVEVVQELLLIPVILLQVLILVFALKKAVQIKTTLKGLLLWTILLMICSITLTFSSFVV